MVGDVSFVRDHRTAANPTVIVTHRFDAEGNSVQYNTYTNSGVGAGSGGGASSIRPDEIKTIGQIKDENIGTSDKMEYFSTKATINFVKHETFSYPACPAEGCNKKVVEESDGWRCEKCDRVYPSPAHR
jgi:replication factor A1